MNVLVISTLYPNRSQPVHALFVEQRVQAMAERFPVRVVCPIPWFPITEWLGRYRHRRKIPRFENRSGVPVYYPRFLSFPMIFKPLDGVFLFLTCLLFAWRIRKEFEFDRVDAHLAFPDGWGAVLLGKILGRPVSVTLRGHDVNDLPRYPVRRRQVAWTLRQAAVVFAVADALREAALELGANPERTLTVGNGVDTSRFRPRDRGDARERVGLPRDGNVILSVGHLVERKGFHHLIRALARVREAAGETSLVIVGAPGEEGDFTRGIESAIAETGLREHVRLAGAVGHDGLADWYSAADVFCLASEKEGRANVVLEALACGTPVVTTNVWGAPEIVSEDSLGLLVDGVDPETLGGALADALARTWNRATISAHAEKFSWGAAAETIEASLAARANGGVR